MATFSLCLFTCHSDVQVSPFYKLGLALMTSSYLILISFHRQCVMVNLINSYVKKDTLFQLIFSCCSLFTKRNSVSPAQLAGAHTLQLRPATSAPRRPETPPSARDSPGHPRTDPHTGAIFRRQARARPELVPAARMRAASRPRCPSAGLASRPARLPLSFVPRGPFRAALSL